MLKTRPTGTDRRCSDRYRPGLSSHHPLADHTRNNQRPVPPASGERACDGDNRIAAEPRWEARIAKLRITFLLPPWQALPAAGCRDLDPTGHGRSSPRKVFFHTTTTNPNHA